MSIWTTLVKRKGHAALFLLVLGGGIWFWFHQASTTQAATRYGFATAETGTIVSSVAGTGQVAGFRQLDVKPSSASGQVTKILVKVGDTVKSGTPLVEIDRKQALKAVRDAQQSLRDAQLSYQSAQLSARKSSAPADATSLLQAQDSLAKAQRDLDDLKKGPTEFELAQAQADVDVAARNTLLASDGVTPQVVRDAYDNYVTVLQSSEQTAEKVLNDADSVLGVDDPIVKDSLRRMYSILDSGAKSQALASYQASKVLVANLKTQVTALAQQGEDPTKIERAAVTMTQTLNQLQVMLNSVSDGLQATLTAVDLSSSEINGYTSTIDGDRSNVNSKISSVLSETKTLQQARDSFATSQINYQKALNNLNNLKAGPDASTLASAEERVQEAQASLKKLQAGPDSIDLQITQNGLAQRQSSVVSAQNRLADAQEALNDYTVRAPFDGVVAKVEAQEGVDASAGSAVVTMMTMQHVTDLSLNEIDAAKVHVGQKASIAFDAIDGLTLTGQVSEVSPLGTVSQGVVTYDVKVAFDGEDERIKSGMSSSVSIVTSVKADVLTVPNAAIKAQGTQHYVEELTVSSSTQMGTDGLYATEEAPKRVMVEVGDANDAVTEITSGLQPGEEIIAQTIRPVVTAKAATTGSATSILGGAGGRATGAGAATFQRGAGGAGFGGR